MNTLPVKKSIYNIEQEYLDLMQEIEQNDGELTEDTEARLAINKDDLEKKAVSYGYYIKTIDNDTVAITAEVDRLTRLKKAREKQSEALKDRIKEAMLKHGVLKVSMNNLTLSFRKSKSLVVEGIATIPKTYKSIKKVETIDTARLKKDVEAGLKIDGVYINEKDNLQIM